MIAVTVLLLLLLLGFSTTALFICTLSAAYSPFPAAGGEFSDLNQDVWDREH